MLKLTLALLAFLGNGFADCTCTGQSTDHIYEGGDGTPLRWKSLERLTESASPNSDAKYCYERRVDNKSDRDVTDIFWKVAGFEKDLVPKQSHVCDASDLLGNLKQPQPQGPLYYSIAPRSYATTVYAPQSGFGNVSAQIVAPTGGTPELRSTIQVAVQRSGTTPSISTISLRSSVQPGKNKDHGFAYELISSGSEKVVVYWNIPLTSDFKTLEMNANSPITLGSGLRIERFARSPDPIGWTPAAVQVFDFDHKWLATGIASVYCSLKGVTEPLLEQPRPRN